MNEYQISVSLDGVFLFRTEWDDNEERVASAAKCSKVVLHLLEQRLSFTVVPRQEQLLSCS